MDLGFTVSESHQRMIIIVFFIYTVLIMGLGLYVKYASRKDDTTNKCSCVIKKHTRD